MSKGGGTAKDRRKISRISRQVAEEIRKTSERSEPEKAGSQTSQSTITQKISVFWGSTPLWAAIGMLAGALASRFSLTLIYGIIWVIGIIDFGRIGFFTRRKILGNASFSCVFAIFLFAIWKLTPKPQTPPTLDQQANVYVDAFTRRLPWLAQKPEISRQTLGSIHIARPWVISSWRLDQEAVAAPNPTLRVLEDVTNTGDALARREVPIGGIFLGDKGLRTENQVFNQLRALKSEESFDQFPGVHNTIAIEGRNFINPQTGQPWDVFEASNAIFSGTKFLYIAFRVTYQDNTGTAHSTEQCLVGTNLADGMHFCTSHNAMY